MYLGKNNDFLAESTNKYLMYPTILRFSWKDLLFGLKVLRLLGA